MDMTETPARDRPIRDEAVPFPLDELFFSRTDGRGVILSGNGVFHRIARYDWDQLLGAPHKIIRHPHMPRGVFWLLWDTIRTGRPIGAYVKNRARDGRYYWVFATVTPMGGGYLSVRLKPSSPLLGVVEAEYAALLELERTGKLKHEESAAVLLRRLRELGFADYPSFMAAALAAELNSRQVQRGRDEDFRIAHFNRLIASSRQLLDEAGLVSASYEQNQLVSFNLRIQAACLGRAGRMVDVVSQDYSALSGSINQQMDAFIATARKVYGTIVEGLFLLCTAKIQREAVRQFEGENDLPQAIDKQAEMALLEQQQLHYDARAREGLRRIADKVKAFARSRQDMQRLAAGLEVTRVMGKIECSRLSGRAQGLAGVLSELEQFKDSLSGSLDKIERLNRSIDFHTRKLVESAR